MPKPTVNPPKKPAAKAQRRPQGFPQGPQNRIIKEHKATPEPR